MGWRTHIRAVLGVAVLLGCACQAHTEPHLVRYLGGERRLGAYVPAESYEAYLQAELFFSRGNYTSALEAFEQVWDDGSEDPYLAARMAECLMHMGQLKSADRTLKDALKKDPDAEALWLVRAQLAEKQGQTLVAIDAYTRAEEAAPLAGEAPIGLARLLRNHGAGLRADVVLEAYLERTGSQASEAARAKLLAAVQSKDIDSASQAAEVLLDAAPARANEVRELAKEAYTSDAPALAARLLDKVSRSEPDEVLRVQALIAAGNLKRARAILVTSSPDRFGGVVTTARLFLEVGLPVRATELTEVALSTRSSDSEARYVHGLCLLQRNQPLNAARDFAKVPPGSRDFVAARLKLAKVFQGRGSDSLALEVLQHGLTLMPEAHELRSALAYLRLKYIGLESALSLYEDVPDARYMAERAKLLELGNERKAAQQVYGAIEAADAIQLSEDVRIRVRTERLWNTNHRTQAVALLRQYIARAPEDLAARIRLIEMAKALGLTALADRIAAQTEPWLYNQVLRDELKEVR